ncbi:hypothetical protein Scep_004691 [Stephania cephalantha]|uniref:Uncharacterized protein n=1 Tax=Stephania cephalantha TaxID=152367 RepID=A0AAP0KUN2_9MAGN
MVAALRRMERERERSGEHKVVAADESSGEIAAAAAKDRAYGRRGSRTATPARLESGQANDSGVRIAQTRETQTNCVGGVEFADRAAAVRAAGALARTTGGRRSCAGLHRHQWWRQH